MALAAEHGHELVVDDLDDLLPGVDAGQDVRAERPFAHARDELLDDLEVDVRLEQGEPDLAQRLVEVGLGDARLATKAACDVLEARGQGFEHGWTDTGAQVRRVGAGTAHSRGGRDVRQRGSRASLGEQPLHVRLGVEGGELVDFLPYTAKTIGTPSRSAAARATPPFALPSSLVSTMPVTPASRLKASAWSRPFWPVVASRTRST